MHSRIINPLSAETEDVSQTKPLYPLGQSKPEPLLLHLFFQSLFDLYDLISFDLGI